MRRAGCRRGSGSRSSERGSSRRSVQPLKRSVDALGGVEMCLDEPVQDDKAHIDLPAGCQVLDGVNALGYARAREFDPTADLGRVQRQRELMGSIASTALSPGTLLNPLALARMSLAGGDALTIDEQTGPIDLARFALGMRQVTSGAGDTRSRVKPTR